ncbi:MAG: DinB family protein [candidate division KSB1 bacterium]
MSSLSNPSSQASENAAAYIKLLMELLGERDPFAVQEELFFVLEKEIAGLDDAILRRPEKPGKWSIAQVLQHLADSELVFRYRMRLALAQPGAAILGIDQDLWASGLKYNEADPAEALDLLRALRKANLKMLRASWRGSRLQ